MARSDTAKGKICRRFGVNLFENPKYDRLLSKRDRKSTRLNSSHYS